MILGILSDTHDELERTRRAIQLLREAGAEALVHCGDLNSGPIVRELAVLPSWFTFGNHDADGVTELHAAAAEFGSTCLEWGSVIELGGQRIGITHGHMTMDLRRVLAAKPQILLTGHYHLAYERMEGNVRRINPGALHRADQFSVALLDLNSNELRFLMIPEE